MVSIIHLRQIIITKRSDTRNALIVEGHRFFDFSSGSPGWQQEETKIIIATLFK